MSIAAQTTLADFTASPEALKKASVAELFQLLGRVVDHFKGRDEDFAEVDPDLNIRDVQMLQLALAVFKTATPRILPAAHPFYADVKAKAAAAFPEGFSLTKKEWDSLRQSTHQASHTKVINFIYDLTTILGVQDPDIDLDTSAKGLEKAIVTREDGRYKLMLCVRNHDSSADFIRSILHEMGHVGQPTILNVFPEAIEPKPGMVLKTSYEQMTHFYDLETPEGQRQALLAVNAHLFIFFREAGMDAALYKTSPKEYDSNRIMKVASSALGAPAATAAKIAKASKSRAA